MLNNEDYLNIFHEIKNSITLIGSSLQLVAKKHPEVKDFDYWNEAMSEIVSLRNIVIELSSARLCGHLNLKSIDLSTLMNEVKSSIRSLSSQNFHCNVNIPAQMRPVEMDYLLIKQALTNLVKNAYEAMNSTGLVVVDITQTKDHVHISVTDTGGGLDSAFADNIFEPFVTSKTGGSGLGLVITRQIIESHHGELVCDSRPGDGCTFTITLPFKQS